MAREILPLHLEGSLLLWSSSILTDGHKNGGKSITLSPLVHLLQIINNSIFPGFCNEI